MDCKDVPHWQMACEASRFASFEPWLTGPFGVRRLAFGRSRHRSAFTVRRSPFTGVWRSPFGVRRSPFAVAVTVWRLAVTGCRDSVCGFRLPRFKGQSGPLRIPRRYVLPTRRNVALLAGQALTEAVIEERDGNQNCP